MATESEKSGKGKDAAAASAVALASIDGGRKRTDKILLDMEKRISKIYFQASKDVRKKLDDYLLKYEAKDQAKRKLLTEGIITKEEYTTWRVGQIMIGKRWEEMEMDLAKDMNNANLIAASVINEHTPEAYAIGMNYGTFQVEKGSLLNTSFTLYDKSTVERILRDDPDLLPKAKVKIPKDIKWNRQQIHSAVLQSILQGSSVQETASRLQAAGMKTNMTKADVLAMKKYSSLQSDKQIAKVIAKKNKEVAIRNARTMMTSAENGGRMDSYRRAESMGIKVEKQWLATLDGRTRHSHADQDGEHVPLDEEFANGLMFPGDMDGDPREVYNCRCTMVAVVEETDPSVNPDEVYRDSRLEDMDYDEWLEEHMEDL